MNRLIATAAFALALGAPFAAHADESIDEHNGLGKAVGGFCRVEGDSGPGEGLAGV